MGTFGTPSVLIAILICREPPNPETATLGCTLTPNTTSITTSIAISCPIPELQLINRWGRHCSTCTMYMYHHISPLHKGSNWRFKSNSSERCVVETNPASSSPELHKPHDASNAPLLQLIRTELGCDSHKWLVRIIN